MYRRHMRHHLDLYPPGDLVSDSYRSAGGDSLAVTFAPFFIALIAAQVVLLPALLWVPMAGTTGLVALWESYVHDSFHLRRHWMSRWGWWRRARGLHMVHHRRMSRNFGISGSGWDRLFGTLDHQGPGRRGV